MARDRLTERDAEGLVFDLICVEIGGNRCKLGHCMGHSNGRRRAETGIHMVSDAGRRASPWVWQRTVDGKRVRTFFKTREEAVRMKRMAEAANRNDGADLRSVFDGRAQREYDAAKKVLGGEVGLVEACMYWREHAAERSRRTATVERVVEEVLAQTERRGTSDHYLDAQRRYLGQFAKDFAGREIASVRGREIIDWLTGLGLGALSLQVVATKIAGLFKRAAALDYVARPPVIDTTALPKPTPKPVETFSVGEVADLMAWVEDKYPQFVAHFALRAFCGLRREEADKMRWEWIDEDGMRIVVPAQVCKTRDNWVLQCPTLPRTVFDWLRSVPESDKCGVVAHPHVGFYRTITRLSPVEWRKNALRHTFCTMHISAFGSAEKTALLLRHRGISTMYNHYLAALVPKDEGDRYFLIGPQKKS